MEFIESIKQNKWTLIIMGCFVVFFIFYSINKEQRLQKNHRYLLIRINKIEGAYHGEKVFFDFYYKKRSFHREDVISVNAAIGEYYFFKFNPENPLGYANILFNCPVPDSITSAPLEGWEELPIICNEE